MFAYYEAQQAEVDAIAAAATGSVRARLGAVMHGKLASVRPQRAMLVSILPRLMNPGDPLSAFSAQTSAVRTRAVGVFAQIVADGGVPADAVPLVANALWLLQLACMLIFVHDTSPDEARTHGLVDDGLDMLVALLPLCATPPGRMIAQRALAALGRAGIELQDGRAARP